MTDFDPDWPYGHITRKREKARIVCKDRNSPDYPILALVGDSETPLQYSAEGRHIGDYYESEFDLMNAPSPASLTSVWLNVYKGGGVTLHRSREEAANVPERPRIACKHVVIHPGEGL